MATATPSTTGREPRLDTDPEFKRTRDALRAANADVDTLDAEWQHVQRVQRTSPDQVALIEAAERMPKLRVEILRGRAAQATADAAHRAARETALKDVTAWHRARLCADADAVFGDLFRIRDTSIAKLQRDIAAALAAGVPQSSLPLDELNVAGLFVKNNAGHSWLDNIAGYLRKHGWLS